MEHPFLSSLYEKPGEVSSSSRSRQKQDEVQVPPPRTQGDHPSLLTLIIVPSEEGRDLRERWGIDSFLNDTKYRRGKFLFFGNLLVYLIGRFRRIRIGIFLCMKRFIYVVLFIVYIFIHFQISKIIQQTIEVFI